MNTYEQVRRVIDQHFHYSYPACRTHTGCTFRRTQHAVAQTAEAPKTYQSDDVLFNEGEAADGLHLIRSGSCVPCPVE